MCGSDHVSLFDKFGKNMVAAPLMGRAVGRCGERNALLVEYLGLMVVFLFMAEYFFLAGVWF